MNTDVYYHIDAYYHIHVDYHIDIDYQMLYYCADAFIHTSYYRQSQEFILPSNSHKNIHPYYPYGRKKRRERKGI